MTAPNPPTPTELLACPFCGSAPFEAPQRDGKLDYQVWCEECETMGPLKRGEEAAIAAWNRRAPVDANASQAAEIAGLREAMKPFVRGADVLEATESILAAVGHICGDHLNAARCAYASGSARTATDTGSRAGG